MKIFTTLSVFIAVALFLTACSTNQPTQVSETTPAANSSTSDVETAGDIGGYAAEDFDLQRVGDLLERAKTPQEFETYLNQPDGINNLDLNGDGYADYISVDEFGDPGSNERGLSMYTNYGPDRRQDLGTVYFFRDEPRYPGARVLINGADNIYGDNNFYGTNWLEKSLGIVSQLFSPKREQYRSPYYFDNYPSGYTTYNVVEQPVYRTRVQQMYPQPIFTYTATAPDYYSKIKVKSPNNGLHLGEIYGKLKKPTREQEDFYKNNPHKPDRAKFDEKHSNDRERPSKSDDIRGRGKKENDDKNNDADKGKGGKPDKSEKHDNGKKDKGDKGKGGKPDHGGKGKGN